MTSKYLFIILGILLSSTLISATPFEKNQLQTSTLTVTLNDGYIDISAQEAWDLMKTSEDGKKILIDIRRPEEYLNERIIPPNEEDRPRFFPYEWTSDGPGPIKNQGILLDIFMNIYQDKEIIIYCRTGRRTGIAAQILIDNGFQGTIYNMVDGITEWKAIGLPTTLDS